MAFKSPKEFLTFSRVYDRLKGVKKLVTPFLILISSLAFSNARLDGITGVSRFIINPQDGSWTVFGGVQGTNSSVYSCQNDSTCNTCIGPSLANNNTRDGACNPSGVFANTIIRLLGTPTGSVAPTAVWLLCNSAQEVFRSVNIQTPLAFTWGDLCNSALAGGTGGNSDCSTPLATTTLFYGVGTDCNNLGQQRVSIRFLARTPQNISSSSNYTDCPSAVSGGYGACHFALFPGDNKAFLETERFGAAGTFPAVDGGPTGITYENVYFFFVEGVPNDDGNTFESITNNIVDNTPLVSNTGFIPVASADQLGGSVIDDIPNERRYCFKMASQDSALNIELFSPGGPAGLCPSGTPTCDDVCTTPSEVIGILTDKKCFIATAAFGSDMDQKVQMLREFRNQFLAGHWLGRKAVKLYYKLSPPLATWISQHDWARALARSLLWPFVLWAELSLKLGWLIFLLPFFILGALPWLIRRHRSTV